MAYPPEFIDELKARVGLAELIGRRVALKKRGREHVGLCPFHSEKTPSFTVSENKGFFHCFGCGAHGSAVDFAMRSEGLTFPEAVERLAQQVGLEVPRLGAEERLRSDHMSELLRLLDAAAGWYESQLAGTVGSAARAYLERRGLRPETVRNFRLGYAPARRDGLGQAMLARQFGADLLAEVGLVRRPDDGGEPYDFFRDRVIFPITDRRGRVVAYGGRALAANAKAKYINSPDSPLFHKGRMLYNLANARQAAMTAQSAILVEGYMDVIALAEAGLAHALAPLGTAVTEHQLGQLWRLAPEPVLCFDGDNAGWQAALRAAERALPLLRPGYSLRFALLPPGRDPDDVARQGGAEAIDTILAAALPLSEVLWRTEIKAHAVDTPERRAALESALNKLAERIGDDKVRTYYRQHFRDRLWQAFRRDRPARRGQQAAPRGTHSIPGARQQAAVLEVATQEKLLATLALRPDLIAQHHETIAGLTLVAAALDRLRQAMLDAVQHHRGLDFASLKDHLAEVGQTDVVDRNFDRRTGNLYSLGQAGATSEEVEAAWYRALRDLSSPEQAEELRALELALAEDTTLETWQRLLAIKQDQPTAGNGADTDQPTQVMDRGRIV